MRKPEIDKYRVVPPEDEKIIIDDGLIRLFEDLATKTDDELIDYIYGTSGDFLAKIERELPRYGEYFNDSQMITLWERFKDTRKKCVETIVKNLIENENENEAIRDCLKYKDILGVFSQLSDLNASKDTPRDIKNRIDSIIERLLNAMNSEKGER